MSRPRGIPADSSVLYSGYAVVPSLLEDIPVANQFSELALQLDSQIGEFPTFGYDAVRARRLRELMAPASRHSATAILERAFAARSTSATSSTRGTRLAHHVEYVRERSPARPARRNGVTLLGVCNSESQRRHPHDITALRPRCGLSPRTNAGPTTFDDATFSEADYLDGFARANNALAQALFPHRQTDRPLPPLEFEEALSPRQASRVSLGRRGCRRCSRPHLRPYLPGLTIAALYERPPPSRRRAFDGILATILAKLKRWSSNT